MCRPGYTLQNSSAGFTCKCDDGILIETCIEDDIILRVSYDQMVHNTVCIMVFSTVWIMGTLHWV